MEPFVFLHPQEHVEEIRSSYEQFCSLAELYTDQPKEINKNFLRLIYDLSHVIHHHDFANDFLDKCFAFLETHPESLPGDVRSALVQAIIVLHNHDVVNTATLITHFVPLFRLNDKNVRRTVYGHFYNRIPFHQTPQIKKELQKFVSHEDTRVAFKTLQLIIAIFHKENKEDVKTINFIARCINMNNTRLINMIVSFFLDPYIPHDEAEMTQEDIDEARHKAEHVLHVNAKNKKNEKALNKVKKLKVTLPQDPVQVISSLDDPQRFAFRLFSLLSQPENAKIFKARESQLRAMELLSKIIVQFNLDFDQFFSWAMRFVRPNYEDITKMLSIIASAIHPLTSPETVYEIIKTIADRFVVEHLDEEVVIVGMNTIREICSKNPHGMTPELLEDLIQYKKESVKGIVMAARGIIQVFRDQRPDILPRREKGKPTGEEVEAKVYGDKKTDTVLDQVRDIAMERALTDEEIAKLKEGREVDEESLEVDELSITEHSKVHKTTKEEKIELANEGKPEKHTFHDRKEGKTAGFTNVDKLKFKPFMLTRFRSDAGHAKMKSLNAIQKAKKKREGKLKTQKMR